MTVYILRAVLQANSSNTTFGSGVAFKTSSNFTTHITGGYSLKIIGSITRDSSSADIGAGIYQTYTFPCTKFDLKSIMSLDTVLADSIWANVFSIY